MRSIAKVFAAYEEKLQASSAVDFDDLLVHVVTILKDHTDVRAALDRRYRYVLVDEYQDTNLAQYAIVRALSVDHPNLCVTGDPDQSIYGWRGANLTNILEFENDYPGCRVVKLERNYRSTKNILSVADHLIRFNRKRKPKSLLDREPAWLAGRADRSTRPRPTRPRGSPRKIVGLVREGEYRFGDVAVFCRMTALTRPIEQAFRSAKIPYQIVGGVSFYERQEVKDVLSYLNLMANPKDDLAFARVVNVPPRGAGQDVARPPGRARRGSWHARCWRWRGRRAAVPGLKDKAIRGAPRLRQADGRADRAARPHGRGGDPPAPRPDGLPRLPGRGVDATRARTAWRTSTSWSRPPASSTASIPGPRSSTSWRRSAWPRRSTAGTRRPAR